jgi:hypothetical protein
LHSPIHIEIRAADTEQRLLIVMKRGKLVAIGITSGR